MIDIPARIREAATDKMLREAARVHWARMAPLLFEDQPRHGLRASDCGACVRAVWHEIHVAPKVFSSDVQIFNLDPGSMVGCWWACLLAASLERNGYVVELEPEVAYDGVPGHIDLFFEGRKLDFPDRGIVEFKLTGSYKPSAQRWHLLQLGTYLAAKGVEDGAIVSTSLPGKKMSVEWFTRTQLQAGVDAEWQRLSAALGPVEPAEDAQEKFRCDGCPVVQCVRNPLYDDTEQKLVESLEAVT